LNPLLLVFDVDGTLIDSQAQIVSSMTAAFLSVELEPPARARILSVVGLSLSDAMSRLLPEASPQIVQHLVEGYRTAYLADREAGRAEQQMPLFEGAQEALEDLAERGEVLLGVATGKARRGLQFLVDQHGWGDLFHTFQSADGHPSKPHPAMLVSAMDACAMTPSATVMIGDTTFDVDMAVAAGASAIGVSWGYHSPAALQQSGAEVVLDRFGDLIPYLESSGRLI